MVRHPRAQQHGVDRREQEDIADPLCESAGMVADRSYFFS
jgi:hypothetical protein